METVTDQFLWECERLLILTSCQHEILSLSTHVRSDESYRPRRRATVSHNGAGLRPFMRCDFDAIKSRRIRAVTVSQMIGRQKLDSNSNALVSQADLTQRN